MRRTQLAVLAVLLLALPVLTLAQSGPNPPTPLVIRDASDFTAIYQSMIGRWTGAVTPYAFDVFYALAGLEFAVFGWNLWMTYGGDFRTALLAATNKILIISAFLTLLLNGQLWMGQILQMFIDVGKAASGMQTLSPSTVLLQGFQIFGTLLDGATTVGFLTDGMTGISLLLAAFFIMVSFLVISYQFTVTLIQTYLALGMGYFFLGFGASRWTVTYVERYFAFCFAAGAKLMVLYMLIGAGQIVANSWLVKAQQVPFSGAGVEAAWLIMCGSLLYAGIVWNLSSLVSNFFGGGPNLGHGDLMALTAPIASAALSAGMIAAGLATGGAAAAAGAAGGAAGRAAGSAAGGTASLAGGAGKPGGVTPPQPTAPSSGGGGGVGSGLSAAGRAAGQMAQVAASAARQMPHGGASSSPPTFHGFHH